MSLKPGKDQQTYVQDMLESARQAAGYVRGMSFDQFGTTTKRATRWPCDWQVVGEAAQHVTAETAARLPHVPIQDVRGMRHPHLARLRTREFSGRVEDRAGRFATAHRGIGKISRTAARRGGAGTKDSRSGAGGAAAEAGTAYGYVIGCGSP